MNFILTVIIFIIVFSVLILIHEAGHFFAAKRAGVKVEEFGMGLPPRLFGVKRGETIYSINWIPFGGFVRMLGEDTTTKESRSSERSFANQPLRTQAWIVVAGVVMNLLLAFVLLTVGFWVGIEPLISTEEDFYAGIEDGTVNVEAGVVVVEAEGSSLQVGDRILTDGSMETLETIEEWQALLARIEAGEETPMVLVDGVGTDEGDVRTETLTPELLTQTVFSPLYLPRLVYREDATSVFNGILLEGDAIIRVNGAEVLTDDDLYAHLEGQEVADLTLYRPGFGDLVLPFTAPVQFPIVTFVQPDSPAELGGIQLGDQILSLNGTGVQSAEEVTQLTPDYATLGTINYEVKRGEEVLTVVLTPREEDGRVGIGLSDLLPNYGNLSLYQSYVPHTLMSFDTVQYGWSAPWVAVQEMGRLAKITAVMFGGVLQQFLSGQGVPEGVAGPVGIAQMTFVTVQAGFAAMLRFVALLSLSLGVINILPIPALDGGKFFFIVVQGITGKKMNAKYEGLIHTAGFFFLICLILYITFNDVMNLF